MCMVAWKGKRLKLSADVMDAPAQGYNLENLFADNKRQPGVRRIA